CAVPIYLGRRCGRGRQRLAVVGRTCLCGLHDYSRGDSRTNAKSAREIGHARGDVKTRLALVIACSLVGLIAVGLVLNTGGMAATTSASPRLNPVALEPRALTAFMDGFMYSNLGRLPATGARVVL